MATIEIKGTKYEVDDENGSLASFNDWTEDWRKYCQKLEGVEEYTDEHKKVINFLQEYYLKNNTLPSIVVFYKEIGYTPKKVKELFPKNGRVGARIMAGIPKVKTCY